VQPPLTSGYNLSYLVCPSTGSHLAPPVNHIILDFD
jgi:hypothetical protein